MISLQSVLELVVLALASTAVTGHLNFNYYCDRALSCFGQTNSMCGKQALFSQYCRKPQYVPITNDLKGRILDVHNALRNYLAMGGLGYIFQNQVSDMATMSWDDELEMMALTDALQCKAVNDQCRRTAKYNVVGQNVYEFCSSPQAPVVEDVIWKSVNSWFDNYVHVQNINEMLRFGSTHAPRQAMLFTQMVQSKSSRIGCSIVRHVDYRNYNCVAIRCNYNVGNLINYPVIKVGTAASQCIWSNNPKYLGLCSPSEDYGLHQYANVYFNKNALISPTLAQWLQNGKRLDITYVQPITTTIYTAPITGWVSPALTHEWITPVSSTGWIIPSPNPGWTLRSMNGTLARPKRI